MTPFQETLFEIAEIFLTASVIFVIVAFITALVTLSSGRRGSNKQASVPKSEPDNLELDEAEEVQEAEEVEEVQESEKTEEAEEVEEGEEAEKTEQAAEEAEEAEEAKATEAISEAKEEVDSGVVTDVQEATEEAAEKAKDAEWDLEEFDDLDDEVEAKPTKKKSTINVGTFATGFTIAALICLTVYISLRWAVTGHAPFSNQHEFAVSFSWGILVAYLVALWRFKIRMLSLVVLPVTTGLLLYAFQLPREVESLVPALQNSLLLTIHVGFAILAYGAACVSFGAAVLYLIYPKLKLKTSRDTFDEIGYKAAVVTFPLLTIMILVGALWADTAWGRYWGWDPKETAALVTWLLYAGFLHARVARGWRGVRCAWLLIIGFAAVLFAYFGNHFFGGLHSYG